MSDKIEYSRLLMKRSTVSGDVPTVPPITAVTLNQFTPNDIFVGEFFLNAVDDLLWIRTDTGILPIALSGTTGSTGNQTLTQVLFEGNNTGGFDIEVSSGATITYQGLTTGSTTNFLGLDASGNTIVSGVVPGTPDLQSVLFQGNTTGANDISVNVSQKVKGQSGLNWIQPETGDGNLEINVDNELTILGITSGVTDIVLSYDPDTKYVRFQSISGGSSGSGGTSGTSGSSGANGTSGSSGQSGTSGTSGVSGTSGSSGQSGTNGTSGSSGVSGTSGSSGVSGSAGESGTSGSSGSSGSSGISGDNGTSGTSGSSGENGTSGSSGSSGQSGTSGTSGVSGSNGTSGSSGESGTSGTSGVSGSAGESGTSGSSGSSGTNGTSGTSGISGDALTVYDGTSGVTVSNVTGMTFSGASIVASGQNVTITITGSTDNFVPYNIAIPLNTTGNVTRYISPVEFELSDIKANVYPAPGSENLQINILKNGETIFGFDNIITINSGNTTNQGSDPYTLTATTFNEWDEITISATTFSGATILYLNGCQEESCSSVPPSPTPTPTPTPTPAPSGDTDATAYLAAVVATGGTVDGTITAAVNTLFEDLKTAGIYSKLDVLMPMVGSTKASMLLNAVDPTNSLWGWTEYGGAITYNGDGMTPSLISTSALRSNWTDNDLTLLTNSSGHVSIYCNKLTSVGVMLNGMLDSIGSGYSWLGMGTGGNWYGGIYNDASNIGTTPANQTGLWLMNRTTSTNAQAYVNNVATDVNNTNSSRDVRGDRQAIFTLYWAGQGFTNNLYDPGVSDPTYSTITYGSGLTSTEKTDLYNIITAFNTALSRA